MNKKQESHDTNCKGCGLPIENCPCITLYKATDLLPKESHEGVEEEKIFRAFLQLLNDEQFVSSTDSETGETVEFPDAVENREATIAISGEYDTESLKKAVCGFVREFTSLNTKKHE